MPRFSSAALCARERGAKGCVGAQQPRRTETCALCSVEFTLSCGPSSLYCHLSTPTLPARVDPTEVVNVHIWAGTRVSLVYVVPIWFQIERKCRAKWCGGLLVYATIRDHGGSDRLFWTNK